MLEEVLRQVKLFSGTLVLLVLFIVPASLLESAGYKTVGTVLGWVGVVVFALSLLSIALEPLVRVFRKAD